MANYTLEAFNNAIKELEACARDTTDKTEQTKFYKKIRELKQKKAFVFANLLLDVNARFE